MDDAITCTVLGVEGLFFLVCFVILIYLIVKRVKAKKKETFEKRDN
jgi:hypothetical protein